MLRRGTKTLLGIGIVGLGTWTMAQTYSSSEGAATVVNGKVALIRAPNDGYISFESLHRGSALEKGNAVATLLPAHIEGSNDANVVVQTQARADALRTQIAGLQPQIDALKRQSDSYRDTRTRELQSKLAEANASIAAARAKQQSALTIRDRQQRLFSMGYAIKATVDSAQDTATAAEHEREAAEKRADGLKIQLAAAQQGTFVGDGYNDSSYSRQRADQLALRLNDLQAELRQQEALLAALTGTAARDKKAADNDEKSTVTIDAPVSGVVWSVDANSGQYVRAGDEVAKLIDCSQLFADVVVSQRSYGGIKEGTRAAFREEGQKNEWSGTVVWAGVADRSAAATFHPALQPSAPDNARYEFVVAFTDAQQQSGQCPVGKPGRVTFDTQAGGGNSGLARFAQLFSLD